MPTISRRAALGAMAAAGWGAVFAQAGTPARKRPPNIIFILADDLGYGDLGCYGQERIQTPCLDRMAAEGLRFSQAYAGSTVCAPSRCALMTGMHMGHAWIRGNDLVPLRPEDLTVAEVLKDAGYATGVIGKWGLGEADTTGIPKRKGFDEFFGYLNQYLAQNYYPDRLWRNETEETIPGNIIGPPNVAIERAVYSHDLFTAEARSFIERHHGHPFFLYLAYTIPHANNERGRGGNCGMETPSDEPYSDRPWPPSQRNHAAMITRMDRDIGILLDLLRGKGIAENTLVLFSSDNGPHQAGGADPAFFQSGGPLRGIKRDLYEGGIRVPALAWWPGVVTPGTLSDHIWAFWDFLPTAADLAGVAVPRCDGISIAPLLLGKPETQQRHAYLYWEFHERGFCQAARMGDWKAARVRERKQVELYHLPDDIGEERDRAAERPDLVAAAERLFHESRVDHPHWPIRAWTAI